MNLFIVFIVKIRLNDDITLKILKLSIHFNISSTLRDGICGYFNTHIFIYFQPKPFRSKATQYIIPVKSVSTTTETVNSVDVSTQCDFSCQTSSISTQCDTDKTNTKQPQSSA